MSDKGKEQFRLERDAKGEVEIAAGAYYGINTARTKNEWFWVDIKTSPLLIKSYLYIKQAYARTHGDLKSIDEKIAQAVIQACEEMRTNNSKHFIAESLQSISGTTLNTNTNEVLANRSEEILGGKVGEYKLVPVEETVNLNQNADSLFLLATKIAVLQALAELEPEILNLERLLRRDALTLAKVLKVSAMPRDQSTTGQWGKRLNVFTTELEIAIKRIKEAENNLLYEANADGENSSSRSTEANNGKTEINKLMLQNLSTLTGFRLKEEDLQAANNGQSEFVISDLGVVSSALKDLATVLSKVASVTKIAHTPPQLEQANESAPATPVQIFADSLHMSAYQVVSNNFAFTFLAQCEQLESVMLMPLLSHNLLTTIEILKAILLGFQRKGLL
jgi:aspartate ammonia-lyase